MGSEYLRIKGILDEIGATEEETKMIAEVSRIKAILDEHGYKSDQWVLCDLLKKLKQMVVSMKVLEATMIGKSVSNLGKHAMLKDIRRTARRLIGSWRRMVDEWMIVNDTAKPRNGKGIAAVEARKRKLLEEPKLQTMVVLEKECFPGDDKKNRLLTRAHMPCASVKTPTKSIVSMTFDKKTIDEKLEATKRKLREDYKEVEKSKRQRRTQVIEVHEVLRLGLAPKHQDRRSRHMIRPNCVGLVR